MAISGSGGRLAIIAGGGKLPYYVALAAREQGENPFIFALLNENTSDWQSFDHMPIGLGEIARFKARASELGVDRIVMSGSVSRRPPLKEIRLGFASILKIPSIVKKLTGGGDNTVLTTVIELLEDDHRKVIGVQQIAPGLLANTGPITKMAPGVEDLKDIRAAVRAARLIGTLDLGQGAVAVGGRVVALEGPEGTDSMLHRVLEMRGAQKISQRKRGVLVKLCKPGQDMRVDLPSAGLATIRNAHKAGLAGIAVEAGRSLLLDADEVCAYADEHGLFVFGLQPEVNGEAR